MKLSRRNDGTGAEAPAPARPRIPYEVKATALLLGVLVAVNAVAAWGIFSAREDARRLALQEVALQTGAHARTLEAVLATLRGDFIFLSYSPPLSRAPAAVESPDPVTRRWSRLAIEAAVILFLEAHPAIEQLQVRSGPGEVVVAAGRREGYPVLLPPRGDLSAEARGAARLVRVSWPLGAARGETPRESPEEGDVVEALIDPVRLLLAAAPGSGGRLSVDTSGSAEASSRRDGDRFVVTVPVRDERWNPPIEWTLVRREDGGRMIRSVESLAVRYRITVALNLAVMTLTLVLGLVAFRQVRRATRAEAESRHQARERELEHRIWHSERLASLGRLSAGIAHEVNNPLEGMRNYLALLEEDLDRGATRDAATMVPKIREGLDRVATIVRKMLRFGAPGRPDARTVDLAAVVDDALGLVRADRRFAPVRIDATIDARTGDGSAPPMLVQGDPTALHQLVLNLVLNACQAQPDGGEVTLRCRRERDRILLEVADRGPGFSDEALEHLFEPFFSTRDSSGLGLSVVHGIVAEHGGAVRGENRRRDDQGEGGGARVVVELPAAPHPDPAKETPS